MPDAAQVEANQLVLRISPDPASRLWLSGLDSARQWRPVRLDRTFERDLGTPRSPYERLLADALAGDDRLFAWQDAVAESWRILRPALAYPRPARLSAPGTWGPSAADDLVEENHACRSTVRAGSFGLRESRDPAPGRGAARDRGAGLRGGARAAAYADPRTRDGRIRPPGRRRSAAPLAGQASRRLFRTGRRLCRTSGRDRA
ncbi:hypothetical protein [Amycolatopsis sp. M39]|uniref:hypothetical protein n=1 Tax=Amycolatopsis sp. M39 TaxID=1825094 RepID=UPI003510A22D